jgi:hypothetical protein
VFNGCDSLRRVYFLGVSIPRFSQNKLENCVAYYQQTTSQSDKDFLMTVFGSILLNNLICFGEDTKILTDKGYINIQDLKKGDNVKTLKDGFKSIKMIGSKVCLNYYDSSKPWNVIHKIEKCDINELTEDLYLTGMHPLLVSEEVYKKSLESGGLILKNPKKDDLYRLLSYNHVSSVPIKELKEIRIWNLVLESDSRIKNYGIYANGLLVESMKEFRYIKRSGLNDLDSSEYSLESMFSE